MRISRIHYRYCLVLVALALLLIPAPSATQAVGSRAPRTEVQTTSVCQMSPPYPYSRGTAQDVVIDGGFDNNCPNWVFGTGAARVSNGVCTNTTTAQLSSTVLRPSFYQDITVPAASWANPQHADISASIYIDAPANASWYDIFRIGISYQSNPSVEVENVAAIQLADPSKQRTCARMTFPVRGDYRGQAIRLKFYATLYTPGESIRIDDVSYWLYSW
ncbi:MAG TPA: hypothetical protein VFZ66_02205 [Herpetosiphonaceae bacterium]